MPRTKLDKFSRPKTDPLKGLILAAGKDQGKSADELAKMAGVSRSVYYEMIKTHSDNWPLCRSLGLCKGLRIPIDEMRLCVRY